MTSITYGFQAAFANPHDSRAMPDLSPGSPSASVDLQPALHISPFLFSFFLQSYVNADVGRADGGEKSVIKRDKDLVYCVLS